VSTTLVKVTVSAALSGCTVTAGSRAFSVRDKSVSVGIYSAPRVVSQFSPNEDITLNNASDYRTNNGLMDYG